LRDARLRINIGNHRWLDEIAFVGQVMFAPPASTRPSFLADFDVTRHFLERLLLDTGPV
jgi:hypothetical protein